MVVHIAIDGITGVGKTTQSIRLAKFFQKKNYRVAYLSQPSQESIIYIFKNLQLSNDQTALLMAVDRSITYYENDFNDLDIVVWDGSILSDYAQNTDEKVNNEFIKNVNRYFPSMDLYILLKNTASNTTPSTLLKYEKMLQAKDNITQICYSNETIDEVFENIVKKCFEMLPRCNWCGRIFTKSSKNKKYCSNDCRKYAREEQNRENNRNYYYKYRDTLTERQKNQLGSKGANLHSKADKDFKKEEIKVKNGLKALGIHKQNNRSNKKQID